MIGFKQEIQALVLAFEAEIHEAYSLKCRCGEGEEGERACHHCSALQRAREQFMRDLDELWDGDEEDDPKAADRANFEATLP